jgi:hypothetical protein
LRVGSFPFPTSLSPCRYQFPSDANGTAGLVFRRRFFFVGPRSPASSSHSPSFSEEALRERLRDLVSPVTVASPDSLVVLTVTGLIIYFLMWRPNLTGIRKVFW